jgi:hypothetical protein
MAPQPLQQTDRHGRYRVICQPKADDVVYKPLASGVNRELLE